MSSDFPLHRFEEFGRLTAREKAALADIIGPLREYRRASRIRAEGEAPEGFFVLLQGWAAASHTLPNGGRQILKIHLPGDALGTPSMATTQTVEELSALTDTTVRHISFKDFGRLFEDHPRIAAKFMLSIQLERVALMDRLASIGRTTAQQRVAAFILDLLERLEPLGLVNNNTFFMVPTQEQIGDVVGLTSVHTNRSLVSLGKLGLIGRFGSQYTVHDRDALARFSGRARRISKADPNWLPAAR